MDRTTVTLYWNLPADQDPTKDNFSISYDVETATSPSLPRANSDDWNEATGTDGVDNDLDEYEDTNVVAPTTTGDKVHYRVRVGEDGTWSTFTIAPKAFEDPPLVPGAPERPNPVADQPPLGPLASANGSLTQITLTWGYVEDDPLTTDRPTGYELDFVVGDGDTDTQAGDQQYYASLLPESRSGYARSPIKHRGLKPGTQYIYRIFPYKDGVYGAPEEVTGTTEPAVASDTRLNLRVAAEGPTKLKLTWDEPRADGGSDVTGYLIQVSNDVDDNRGLRNDASADWFGIGELTSGTEPNDGDQTAWKLDDTDTMEYVYEGLEPNDARWFRVIALNAVATVTVNENGPDTLSAEAMDAIGSAVPVRGQTARASVPMAPNGLVTEQARNSNLTGAGNRGVLLLWNAPDDPTGAELEGYTIARKVDDGDWDDEWEEIREGDPRTYLTDSDIPATDQMNYYRVAAFNSAGTGDWSNVSMYPNDGSHTPVSTGPTAPDDVMSDVDDADPGSASVTVTWTDGEGATGHLVILFKADFSSHVFGPEPVG